MNFIAYAQAEGAAGALGGGQFGFLIPMVLVMAVFYFLTIRPQQKKEKERKKMLSEIQKGDKVVTIGGIYGTVQQIKEDDTVVLNIGGSTKVDFTRAAIQNKILQKTAQPKAEEKKETAAKAKK